jgi:putative ABC transport system permease protein
MFRTVDRLLGVDPGFSPDGVLAAQISLVGPRWADDAAVYGLQRELVDRVSRLPGVEAAGVTGLLPLGGSFDRRGFGIEGQTYATTDDVPSAERYSVTPGYFAAMRIALKIGRLIDGRDTPDSELVALVNEAAVRKFWNGENPIGQGLTFGTSADSPRVTVVGVVADVRHYDLETPAIPQVYRPQSQSTDSFLTLTVRAPGRLDGLGDQIRREVAALAPDVPVYGVVTLEQRLSASIGTRAFLMTLLMWFAAVSVALSAVGLYGIVSQTVRGREREIGIRVSLGARRLEVARLVMGRGVAMIGVGLAVGLVASVGAARFLETQLFETAVLDPATYATAASGLLAAGLLAHVLPLRRATRVHPNLILRGD